MSLRCRHGAYRNDCIECELSDELGKKSARMAFPKHKCGLNLTHNEHKNYYETIAEYVQGDHVDCFKDEKAKKRSIATDEIWELQWYPNTPIGFIKVSAPTLEEVLIFALEVESRD